MTYWDAYCVIVTLYAMASACGMGMVIPATFYQDAEYGRVSWKAAHIAAFFTAYLPLGLAMVSLLDHSTFGLIKWALNWLEALQ